MPSYYSFPLWPGPPTAKILLPPSYHSPLPTTAPPLPIPSAATTRPERGARTGTPEKQQPSLGHGRSLAAAPQVTRSYSKRSTGFASPSSQTQSVQAVSPSFLQFKTTRKFHHVFTCKTKFNAFFSVQNRKPHSIQQRPCQVLTSHFSSPYIKPTFSFTSPPLACSVWFFFMPAALPISHRLSHHPLYLREFSTFL